MGEIGLGQFLKNVFDYSTGKMPTQRPGHVANENFQKAQNEAVKQINQTMQNIAQNFVRQQDIMNTQMQLKELSNFERSMLLKNLFDFPSSIQDLVQFLATDGKTVAAKELNALMTQNMDIAKLLVLLQTNGKEALSKIQKMITTMNQSGIFDTHQLKEMQALINACIPANDASASQVLKSFLVMYLPWLPLNEAAAFNLGSEENKDGKNSSSEDVMTIIITTKNYGIVKILLYKEDQGYNIDISCCEQFPKDTFNESIKTDASIMGVKPDVSYTVRKASQENEAAKTDEAKVEFSKSSKVSPQLLFIIHSIIKIVMEIDNKGTLNEQRKKSV